MSIKNLLNLILILILIDQSRSLLEPFNCLNESKFAEQLQKIKINNISTKDDKILINFGDKIIQFKIPYYYNEDNYYDFFIKRQTFQITNTNSTIKGDSASKDKKLLEHKNSTWLIDFNKENNGESLDFRKEIVRKLHKRSSLSQLLVILLEKFIDEKGFNLISGILNSTQIKSDYPFLNSFKLKTTSLFIKKKKLSKSDSIKLALSNLFKSKLKYISYLLIKIDKKLNLHIFNINNTNLKLGKINGHSIKLIDYLCPANVFKGVFYHHHNYYFIKSNSYIKLNLNNQLSEENEFRFNDVKVMEQIGFEHNSTKWIKIYDNKPYFVPYNQTFDIEFDANDNLIFKENKKLRTIQKCLGQTININEYLFCFFKNKYYLLENNGIILNENIRNHKDHISIKYLFATIRNQINYENNQKLEFIFNHNQSFVFYFNNNIAYIIDNECFYVNSNLLSLNQSKIINYNKLDHTDMNTKLAYHIQCSNFDFSLTLPSTMNPNDDNSIKFLLITLVLLSILSIAITLIWFFILKNKIQFRNNFNFENIKNLKNKLIKKHVNDK